MKRFFLSHRLAWLIPTCSLLAGATSAVFVSALEYHTRLNSSSVTPLADNFSTARLADGAIAPLLPNGRPKLLPLPAAQETWECEVVVVGGSLGGIAAASQSMKSGAQTCLIELTAQLGGQISAQGVSAIDESVNMVLRDNFADSWRGFKQLISAQTVKLPTWTGISEALPVTDLNRCWVGRLCFLPKVGATAAQQLLKRHIATAPGSRWATSTAFKGAEFDDSGRYITAIHAVRRIPLDPAYLPQGRISVELNSWYTWNGDDTFQKVPLQLRAPAGKRMIVIDATDTGELVGWAQVPHRLGSESRATTGELFAADRDNPECTQAFTFPFTLGIRQDDGASIKTLERVQSLYPSEEHHRIYTLDGTPLFKGQSFFNYRRLVSTTSNNPFKSSPVMGDITLVNWTQGNDWNWMNPPLILTSEKLTQTGQYQNWTGGMSVRALRHAENHSLMFAKWLLETQADAQAASNLPLAYLSGVDSPMGTVSGLSMVPYIREGRRILGRTAYGQMEFLLRESDLREDMEGRDFTNTVVGITHYDIDIHGCRYRNWEPSGEAVKASVKEYYVRPVQIPLESLIPQGVDNLLVGGKAIAATHIATALTRVHHGEWTIGSAAGVTAGWLVTQHPEIVPAAIVPKGLMRSLQQYMIDQGLRLEW